MNFIINVIIGICIGAGAILPGISSGVFCVIFGIYEKLVDSIINFFKNIKENFFFLLTIFIGAVIGIVIFGNILKYLFNVFEIQTKFMTIGLILGCMPSLFKQANNKKGFRLHYLIYTFISFLIALLLIIIENNFEFTTLFSNNSNFYYLVFCGFCMSCGIIIPGISSTVILMCLGVYYIYLNAVSIFDLSILVPMAIGVFIGSIFFLYLIKYLLDKHYSQTFYSIIGFVFGSVFILFPKFIFDFSYIISSLLILLGFLISYKLSIKKRH